MANSPAPASPDLRDHVGMLWRRKWVIAACVVLAVAIALAYSLTRTPLYRATAEVAINATTNVNGVAERPRAVAGEVNLARAADVRRATREVVGAEPNLDVTGSDAAGSLTFTAVSDDPELAAQAADAYAEAFMNERRALRLQEFENSASVLQQQIAGVDAQLGEIDAAEDEALFGAADEDERAEIETEFDAERTPLEDRRQNYTDLLDSLTLSTGLAQGGGAQLLNPAEVPSSPFSPNTTRNVALAVILGFIAGVGLAYLLEYLDTKLRDDVDLAESTGLPTLAVVPLYGEAKQGRRKAQAADPREVASLAHPHSEVSEAFRRLRTSVQFLGIDRPLKVVQFTSPSMGDGKTTAAANLAVTAARAGQRVILIDCDLRRPRQHEAFGLDNEVGLTSVLLGEVALTDAVQRVDGLPQLLVLPAGPLPADPAEVLASGKMADFVASLRGTADLVVLDTPPVLAVSDPLIASRMADGVLLVSSVGRTDRRQLSQTMVQLRQVDAPLIGTVLNRFETKRNTSYGYGYGYGGGYASYGAGPQVAAADRTPDATPSGPMPGPNGDSDAPSVPGRSARLLRRGS